MEIGIKFPNQFVLRFQIHTHIHIPSTWTFAVPPHSHSHSHSLQFTPPPHSHSHSHSHVHSHSHSHSHAPSHTHSLSYSPVHVVSSSHRALLSGYGACWKHDRSPAERCPAPDGFRKTISQTLLCCPSEKGQCDQGALYGCIAGATHARPCR